MTQRPKETIDDIEKRIEALEAEIDTCLSCDLPMDHLEQELKEWSHLIGFLQLIYGSFPLDRSMK